MTAATAFDWHIANQQHLTAALSRLRAILERHAARPDAARAADDDVEPYRPMDATDGAVAAPALNRLCAIFALSAFERDLLLLCAAVELDARFSSLCAAACGEPSRPYPTFSLALAALHDAHWSALSPAAPLRRWRLIEPGAGSTLTLSPLRIDERVLHYLTGVQHVDERLAPLVEPVMATGPLVPSHAALAEQIVATWSTPAPGRPLPVIQLCGEDEGARREIAADACERLGLQLVALPAETLPAAPSDLAELIRLWEREAALSVSALLLDCDDLDAGDAPRAAALRRMIRQSGGAILVSSRERRRIADRSVVQIDVAPLKARERQQVWEQVLGSAAGRLNGQISAMAEQFNLGTAAIYAAGGEALGIFPAGDAERLSGALWDACRGQARPRMEDLAQRVESTAGWDDLVLPDAQRRNLRDIVAHVRHRGTVYELWGFRQRGERGLGISVLFAGASGTGKTYAAEVMARELRLDLYRIDLSQVVSKYIGETEKALRRVFDAAEAGGAVLLFDEADALFGKRSEVKDSHDRYANIEVSYLLQRMEAYRGLAILTTNMKHALDSAFLRRIRFVVQFPFPDVAQRTEIWRRMFPHQLPTRDLDLAKLAQLNVAGGNIRNIALTAAFYAADAGEPVSMALLKQAARHEYAKLEKPLTETEIGGWV